MIKRFAAVTICMAVALLYAGVAFSQSTAGDDVEEVTKDSPTAAVGTEAASDRAVTSEAGSTGSTAAEYAKTYFDGVYTFANSKVKFELFTTDNFYADKIIYKINDGAETEYTAPFAIAEEGDKTIKYHGVDKIGNKEDEKVFRVIVDNTAPETNVVIKNPIALINGVYYTSKTNAFTVMSTDALSGFYMAQYSLNGKDYNEYANTFNFNVTGDTDLAIVSEDNVGNKTKDFTIALPMADGSTKVEKVSGLKLNVDNIAPTVAIKSDKALVDKLGKKVAAKDYKYTVTGEDKESGLKQLLVRVDGKGEFVPYEKEITIGTNGDHFIEAKSIDNVGNVSDVAVMPVFIDIIPPKSQIRTLEDKVNAAPAAAPADKPADVPVQ